MPIISLPENSEVAKFYGEVVKRIKEQHGFEPKSLNLILGYATDYERKEMRRLFGDEIEKSGNDRAEAEKLFDTIETNGIAERHNRELGDPTVHLYQALPRYEPFYSSNMLRQSKHSGGCNRKPKPRRKVKHGNRKKKR